eukprot:GSMAST32.ASY1.ANO1.1237.1 assembled CDS
MQVAGVSSDKVVDDASKSGCQTRNFMKLALEQAQFALDRGEVPVGCVLVADNRVIAAAGNETNISCNATRHSLLRKSDLYVTVEPCIMCASALSLIGIRKVYFGCHNERFGGNGSVLSLHENCCPQTAKGYPVVSGILKDEAIEIMRLFYSRGNPKAPDHKRQRPLILQDSSTKIDRTTTSEDTDAKESKTCRANEPFVKRQKI